jgi:nitrite reductase (NADH) small subunit
MSNDISRTLCAGPVDELPPGARRIVSTGSGSIGVFNVDGCYYAIRNHCPHEGAELCRGKRTGTNLMTDCRGDYQWGRKGMVIRCPWHAWEFDLQTGCSLFSEKLRVRTYPVSIREGQLWIELDSSERNP